MAAPGEPESVREILLESVSRQVRAYVTCAEHSTVFEGVCAGILEDEVIVEVTAGRDGRASEVLVPTTQVVLSFTYDQKTRCGLTNLRRFLPAERDGIERLVLGMPAGFATANGRMLYRVDVTVIEGLECMIGVRGEGGGGILHASVRDISDSGVFVTFADGVPDLSPRDSVAVTLAFDGKRVTVDGVVRRRDAEGIGIYFPVVVEDPELNSPPELRAMVQALERAWLSHRVRTSGYGYD